MTTEEPSLLESSSTAAIAVAPTETPRENSFYVQPTAGDPAAGAPMDAPTQPPTMEGQKITFDALEMINLTAGFAIIDHGKVNNRIMRTGDGGGKLAGQRSHRPVRHRHGGDLAVEVA
ncbi:MAG: hypothetical protein MUO58_22200 [Anaerolineales bacterium]|nr:hypothetical protein [Anaerolineales bacterium]